MYTIRKTENRKKQIERLESTTGLKGITAVLDFALAFTLAHLDTKKSNSRESKGKNSD